MDLPTHIIDPDGEVVIILRNADRHFAELPDSMQSPVEEIENSIFHFEQSDLTPKQKRKMMKRNQRKASDLIGTTLDFTSPPNVEPSPAAEEPIAEEPIADEPTAEEPTAEEPTADEPTADEPTADEPTADEPTADEPTADEPTADEPTAEEPTADEPAAILVVPSCSRIQVSAKHLMFASPIFKKIITGGWKESIHYLQKGSVEVTAESWDIEALLIMLRAIHGQFYNIPRKLTLDMLAKVAVIADYYECKEALCMVTDIWISNLEESIPTKFSRDLILWLWIAWFFQLPSQFKQSTSIAMSRSNNEIDSLGLPIPGHVIDSMNICRHEAIENLVTLLHETRNAFLNGTRGCGFECRSIMYGALTVGMESSNLLSPKPVAPFPNLNYNRLARKIMAFKSPRWHEITSGYSSYGSSYPHSCSNATFAPIFALLDGSLGGLELEGLTG